MSFVQCGSRGVAAIPMVRRCGVPLSSGDGADKGKCLPQECRIIYRGQDSAVSMAGVTRIDETGLEVTTALWGNSRRSLVLMANVYSECLYLY